MQQTRPVQLSLADLLLRIQQKIETLLQVLKFPETEIEDQSWYWAAPLLLDRHFDPDATRQWFSTSDLAQLWAGEAHDPNNHDPDNNDDSLWSEHVKLAKRVVETQSFELGKPPSDLAWVLAEMAIGSPGVVALRSLSRVAGGASLLIQPAIRTSAAQIAWSFRTLFNSPEATALLRGINSKDAYWRSVLNYCMGGCLQSLLDEYAHILRESPGLVNETPEKITAEISRVVVKALTLRTSVMSIDEVHANPKRGTIALESYRVRGHFALRFGEEQSDDDRIVNRTEQVRGAFNSPFRPFVLATTSVGQEGLDFHPYCHAIVHWNLPSNPVDLEQREGRVHRYKGHAVRKNLALYYGLREVSHSEQDPWEMLFAAGKRDRPPQSSDLIPFWIYPLAAGAKIERYVPNLPLSRECDRLAALRRSLAAYRMVFGQSRQEDLLAYLLDRLSKDELEQVMHSLQINLEPPQLNP